MYAIIEAGGKQIRVASGDEVVFDSLAGDVNTDVIIEKVLMISKDDKTIFGKPYIQGAQVKAEIIKTGKMPKVLVFKHVPKKAHEKLRGHRQTYATLKIKEIIGG